MIKKICTFKKICNTNVILQDASSDGDAFGNMNGSFTNDPFKDDPFGSKPAANDPFAAAFPVNKSNVSLLMIYKSSDEF